MEATFNDALYKEFVCDHSSELSGSIIKANDVKFNAQKKISIEDELHTGVKIVLEKDEHDNLKEIKFYCSCGQTKSVVLDYTD